MNLFPDDYNERLDKYIKDELKKVIKPTHPCEHQKKNCLKGSSCPLIGLPNDICTYDLSDKCKHKNDPEKCKYKHDKKYSTIYQNAKTEFRNQEKQPLAIIRRYWFKFAPYLTGFLLLLFHYILRKILDSVTKRIFH